MKKVLFFLILSGCSVSFDVNINADGGIKEDSAHLKNKKEYVANQYKYYCMNKCYGNLARITYAGTTECESKCDSDTGFVLKTLGRAVAEGKEKDFDDLFDQWTEK